VNLERGIKDEFGQLVFGKMSLVLHRRPTCSSRLSKSRSLTPRSQSPQRSLDSKTFASFALFA
jgi:hypothetical protein